MTRRVSGYVTSAQVTDRRSVMDTAQVTALVGSVDFGPVIVGMLGIATAVAVVLIARRGIKMILGAVRS